MNAAVGMALYLGKLSLVPPTTADT